MYFSKADRRSSAFPWIAIPLEIWDTFHVKQLPYRSPSDSVLQELNGYSLVPGEKIGLVWLLGSKPILGNQDMFTGFFFNVCHILKRFANHKTHRKER